MSSQTNEQCANCPKSYLGVNGRYCRDLNRYVEYMKVPPCGGQQLTAKTES